MDDNIIASDKKKGTISIYTPTEFVQSVIDATKEYYVGNWDEAGEKWLQSLKHNDNYYIAYVGYGKMLYMQDKYEDALKYFELGNNRSYYSMAYKKYRLGKIKRPFWAVYNATISIIWNCYLSEYKYHKKAGEQ